MTSGEDEVDRRNSAAVRRLGTTPFNYSIDAYTPERFLHYRQQILHVLALRPARVLEVGPGDHTVTDFLRRKGVTVHTFDFDAELHPDFVGDVRAPLLVDGPYDVVLASEVLEHFDFRWFDTAVGNLAAVVRPGGHLVLSLPFATVRLFPPRARYGRVLSAEGRIRTHIPIYAVQPLLTILRAIYKIATRASLSEALRTYRIRPLPEDKYDVHHWDLGVAPTTKNAVRRRLEQAFAVTEHVYDDTNAVFFVLEKRP